MAEELSSEDVQRISKAVVSELTNDARSRWIPSDKHAADHELMDEIRAERELAKHRRKRWNRIQDDVVAKVLGGIGWAAVGGMLLLMGYGMLYWLDIVKDKPLGS